MVDFSPDRFHPSFDNATDEEILYFFLSLYLGLTHVFHLHPISFFLSSISSHHVFYRFPDDVKTSLFC